MTAPVHPYSTPAAKPALPAAPAPIRPSLAIFVVAGIVAFAVGIGMAFAGAKMLWLPLGLSSLCFFVAFLRAGWHQLRLFVAPAGVVTAWAMLGNFGIVLLSLGASAFGALTAFVSTLTFTRGRQVRRRGKQVFAPLTERGPSADPAVEAPAGVGVAWRRNGLTEHASVAAFARVSLELMALGAPRRLVDAAHADAIDESRHTDLCFDLARRFDGRDVRPGAFPAAAARPSRGPRTWRLCRLAVDSLIDGAINEGVSARVVASLSKEVEDEAVADVLRSIARDEGRHAVHGFEVLAWCVMVGGAPVAAAVESALHHLPATLGAPLHETAVDGSWERYGIPGRSREEEAFLVVRHRTAERVRRLLAEVRKPNAA